MVRYRVEMIPRLRQRARVRSTVSRHEPIQEASSAWLSLSGIWVPGTAVVVGSAVAFQIAQEPGEPAVGVIAGRARDPGFGVGQPFAQSRSDRP